MRITVVTPSFNQAAFLEDTILSVLTQDYNNVQYIVMDGGSNDGSLEIIRRYADRISHWQSAPDGGQAAAIAEGFTIASGEILCWLNSDDILLPGALSKVAAFFRRYPECEVVSGGAVLIDERSMVCNSLASPYTLGVPATYSRLRFYGQEGVYQQGTFWRKSAYDAVGGLDTRLQFIMDLDLFARLAKRRPFCRLPDLLACFRLHRNSKTSTMLAVHERELVDFRALNWGGDWASHFGSALRFYYKQQSRVRRARLALAMPLVLKKKAPHLWNRI